MKSRKIKLLTAAIVLAVLAVPAAVFAYFTDYEGAYGGAQLKLESETELHEEPSNDRKTISIKNVGDTDVVVRLAVFGDYLDWKHSTIGDGWVKKDDWFYYNQILAPDESTSDIVAIIDTEAAATIGHDFEIVVVHESERVSYDGTEDNKVNKPEGWTNMPVITAADSEEVGD